MSGKDWLFSLIFTLVVLWFVNYPKIALITSGAIIVSILLIFIIGKKVLDYSSKQNKEKFKHLKDTYPNAYRTLCFRNHIWKDEDSFTDEDYIKFPLKDVEEWKSLEMKYLIEKKINDEYDELKSNYSLGLQCWVEENSNSSKSEANRNRELIIEYDKRQKEFIRLEQWENDQKQFCTLVKEKSVKMPKASRFSLDIKLPRLDYQKKQIDGILRVPRFIFFRYCTNQNLDYTNFTNVKKIGENIDRFKSGQLTFKDCIHHEIIDFLKALEVPLNVFLFAEETGEKEVASHLTDLLQSKGIMTYNIEDLKLLSSKNIVLIDIVSSDKQVKERVINVFNKYCSFEPSILYISFVSEITSHIMQEIIDHKNQILRAQRLQQEQNDQIQNKISAIDMELKACNLEEARKELDDLKTFHSSKDKDAALLRLINQEEEKIQQFYKEGIVEDLPEQYVDYNLTYETQDSISWRYPVVKYATYRNVVFPYRRRLIARRGYTENNFQSFLSNVLRDSGLLILGDCNILASDNSRPYEPDIAIICLEDPSIRIDVEIDEPYAAITNKPIHYIGGGDDFRDLNLNNLGWTVIRFTERQIFENPKGCAAFITQVFRAINPSLNLSVELLNFPLPDMVHRWSEIESKIMACEKLRENYLGHEFGIKDDEQLTQGDIKQTELEKKRAGMIAPIHIDSANHDSFNCKYSESILERDKDIQFSAYEHIYLYKGKRQFIPVSNLISLFFKPYDSFYWSARKADQWHVPQGQVLEEWDAKGVKSTRVGTFMHKQIENYYKGGDYGLNYHFTYDGNYIHQDEEVVLEIEKGQFDLFIEDHPFKPFRTEWTIFDENLGIAGTIDMIKINENGSYEIYDWKRSHRIIDSITGVPITTNYYGEKGIRGLEDVEDTAYWHYCIQQNLYRYILEKNYGIKVDRMYLVVFTDDRIKYSKLEVPQLDNIVQNIVTACKRGDVRKFLENIH